jgi:large subunit ribosomal protein L24
MVKVCRKNYIFRRAHGDRDSGDDKNRQGKVLEVIRQKKAIFGGRNMIKKHNQTETRRSRRCDCEKEAPIQSQFNVFDPKTGSKTRVGRSPGKDGKLGRYSIKFWERSLSNGYTPHLSRNTSEEVIPALIRN